MGAPTQDRTVFKKEDFYYYNDDYYYYYNDGNLPVLKKQVNFSPPPLPTNVIGKLGQNYRERKKTFFPMGVYKELTF